MAMGSWPWPSDTDEYLPGRAQQEERHACMRVRADECMRALPVCAQRGGGMHACVHGLLSAYICFACSCACTLVHTCGCARELIYARARRVGVPHGTAEFTSKAAAQSCRCGHQRMGAQKQSWSLACICCQVRGVLSSAGRARDKRHGAGAGS